MYIFIQVKSVMIEYEGRSFNCVADVPSYCVVLRFTGKGGRVYE